MAISQAIVPAQVLAEDCCYSCDRYHPFEMSSVLSKKGEGQRGEQRAAARGKTDARLAKANRTLSRGGVGKIEGMSTSTSGAHFKDARMSNDKGIVGHRRGSSQSLTLDLVGLDLGRQARLESMGEEAGSKNQPSYAKQPSPVRPRDAEQQKQQGDRFAIDSSQQKAGEDSFFAHLRSCEDSHDILTSSDVLPVPDPSNSAAESTKGEEGPHSICSDSSEQVLGGFASLGYDSNAQSRNNLDLDTGANSAPTSTPASPCFGITPSQAVSPWRTLVPIVHDAMETLDTLSIEEMGLHSINVGSSDDWEGVTLSYPCETCHHSEVPEMGNAVDAQWTVARSMKRQRKWIVTPKSPTSSRTVVISDHVVSRQEQQQQQQQTLSGQATFELRFLQANNAATSSTILLASPAIHRLLAAEGTGALEGSDSTPALSSLGVHEEQSRPAPITASVQVASTSVSCGSVGEDRRPMMPPKAATVAHTDELKLVLGHSKSSSTIHASVAMVDLESRRPSLGKSISHDSIAFHPTSPASNSPRPSTYMAPTASDNIPLSMRSLQKMNSMLSLPQPPLDRLPTESFAPFGDYTIGLDPLDSPGTAATGPLLTSSGLGPSPRTSIQDVRSHQSMRDRTPVLSLVDPSRMADYHRHQMEAAGNAPPVRWNTSWQPMSPNSMAKFTLRKDQRLSDWFRKKVLPITGSSHMNILSPPLPPAWEPKREQRMQGVAIPAMTRMTPRGAKSVTKGAKSVKALSTSTTSATTLATTTSSDGDTGQQTTSETGDATSPVESPSSTSQSSLSSLTKEESREGEQSNIQLGDADTVPLAQMHTFHGHNVWPGVFSTRNERRRSNSDDNLAALGEAEKRRLEVLGKEWATRKPQMTTVHGNFMAPNNDDSLVRFSSSMPPHSVLCLYGDYARRRPRLATPVDLIGLVDAPAQSITMVVPLPMASNDGVAARYLRVSFVPFGLDSAAPSSDGNDAGRISMDQAMLPPAALHSSQAVSHATWYKKLTHVWGANARSGNPSSNEEEPESRADRHVACLAPVRTKRRNSTVESFRIIAKILEHPDGEEHQSTSTTGLDGPLPAPFPFPVILGVCDRQRSLKLIPEGWQAIGLLNGPAEAGTNNPMSGVADLIIAGCAACMDL